MAGFGDLRAAVQEARENPSMIGDVVWCVLHSDRRDEALRYATDHLDKIDHGTVNLGNLARWVVDGEPALREALRATGSVSDATRYEFLSVWAMSAVYNPSISPPLAINADRRTLCQAWPDALDRSSSRRRLGVSAWSISLGTDNGNARLVATCVRCRDWVNEGVSPHLLQQEAPHDLR